MRKVWGRAAAHPAAFAISRANVHPDFITVTLSSRSHWFDAAKRLFPCSYLHQRQGD